MYFIPCSDRPWPQFSGPFLLDRLPHGDGEWHVSKLVAWFPAYEGNFKCATHFQANFMNGFLIFLHNVLLLYFFKALPLSPVALAFFSLFIHPSSRASSHPERVGVTLPICFQNWSPP